MDGTVLAMLLPSCFFGLYFILEAADWGLCMAAPVVTRSMNERRALYTLLQPGLDGNELWFFIGFYMLSCALPDMKGSGMEIWYTIMLCLVGAGAILRFLAAFCRKFFSASVFMKLLSSFSFVSLFLIGLLGTYILTDKLFTAAGIFCGVWTVLACFQIGCLYGAVKVVNPLGERLRAAFLISGFLSAFVYVVFAIALRFSLGEIWHTEGYFWMSIIATALLFSASFFLTRSRYPVSGLVAAYAASFFAIAMYFSAYVMVIPTIHVLDLVSLKMGMDAIPSSMLLGIATAWTLSVFSWRLFRKKVLYTWEDHI